MHKDLRNPHYTQWRQFLGESEDWTKEQIDEYQFEQLKKIFDYAWEHIKGYRELWSIHGLTPQSLKSLDDVNLFPCVTKEDIRDRLDDFSVKRSDAKYTTTGGSTGIPFGFYRTPEAFGRELASKAWQYYRIGWKEGDPQIVFKGVPITTEDKTEFFPELNELRFSSYYMTPDWLELYIKKTIEYKPLWMRCLPSTGFMLAKYLKEKKISFPELKGILCSSENLYDFQKQYMIDVFKCRVFSHYGHEEIAALAGFCEYSDNYHVLPQYGYVQLLDDENKHITTEGQSGEVVATSFIMNSTFFIRYRTKDIARYAGNRCGQCGRPYQIWDRIDGRLQEFFITKSKRHIPMMSINFYDDIFDELKFFQYYQDTIGVIILKYVPRDSSEVPDLAAIRNKLNAKFDNDVDIIFKEVKADDLTRTRRGKYLFLEQKLEAALRKP